ncbi:dienelactone hydrolase [Leptospira sp. 201903071]|uniref:dienelactone hydrolase n=1 Tax=Leptospira ainazelensis TaxID=2810034 RepID=UPI001965C765|nr:dienelactone hydrolase [Leptospira ainazelensis]MBM9498692.1 dienelactone hydrolase [Leptospira ainazelensis]
MGKRHFSKTVSFPVNQVELKGDIVVPEGADLLVVNVLEEEHSRFADRLKKLSNALNGKKIATFFLYGLLTEKERQISINRLDEELLSDRLISVTHWLKTQDLTKDMKLGYVGLSAYAERFFKASLKLKSQIESFVFIGEIPPLNIVFCEVPLLNIIGALNSKGADSNQGGFMRIDSPQKKMSLIAGSPSHFEDPQKWNLVTKATVDWFSAPESRMKE